MDDLIERLRMDPASDELELEAADRIVSLEQALTFYADRENYKSSSVWVANAVQKDCGQQARAALRGEG